MVRKLVCSMFVMAVCIGFVVADDFNATITAVKDGKVTALIPDSDPDGTGEGVAADAVGNIYGALTTRQALKQYVRPGGPRK